MEAHMEPRDELIARALADIIPLLREASARLEHDVPLTLGLNRQTLLSFHDEIERLAVRADGTLRTLNQA